METGAAVAGITVVGIFLIILGIFFYFLPFIVALLRSHNVMGVFLINLLVGWSVIGWIVALVMACASKAQTIVINNNHSSSQRGDNDE